MYVSKQAKIYSAPESQLSWLNVLPHFTKVTEVRPNDRQRLFIREWTILEQIGNRSSRDKNIATFSGFTLSQTFTPKTLSNAAVQNRVTSILALCISAKNVMHSVYS